MDESVSKVEIQLDSRWLEEREVNEEGTDRVAKSQENNKCFGGVILTNEDGLIVCKNTIDARIELAYQHMLPVIRSSLFNWWILTWNLTLSLYILKIRNHGRISQHQYPHHCFYLRKYP